MIRLLLVLLIALYGAPSLAQVPCGSYDEMTAQIKGQYGETRRSSGQINQWWRVEVWASGDPPYTFTIIRVNANGISCVMAIGDGYEADTPEMPGDDI